MCKNPVIKRNFDQILHNVSRETKGKIKPYNIALSKATLDL